MMPKVSFGSPPGTSGRRDHVTTVVGKETQPFVETPLVQHGGLARDKIFHLAFKQQFPDSFIDPIVLAARVHVALR
jgi:hypothetical protein